MPFAAKYTIALAAIALLLGGLYYVARIVGRGDLRRPRRRIVRVIESTPLQNSGALYVVRVLDAYFLIGANSGGVTTLAELPARAMEDSAKSIETVRSDSRSPQ